MIKLNLVGKVILSIIFAAAFVIYWGMKTIPFNFTIGLSDVYGGDRVGLYIPKFYQFLVFYGLPVPILAVSIISIFLHGVRLRLFFLAGALFFDWYYLIGILPNLLLRKIPSMTDSNSTLMIHHLKTDDFIEIATVNLAFCGVYYALFYGFLNKVLLRKQI